MKFIICTGSYDENVGGSIVPHKLCEFINEYTDSICYLYRLYQYPILRRGNLLKSVYQTIKVEIGSRLKIISSYDKNSKYVIKDIPKELDDYVVIYLESATDNILNAKNVVRLLLHNPGNFTNLIHYGTGELYFRYGPHFDNFKIKGSKTSEKFINIQSYPTDIYNLNDVSKHRDGNCYALRKGKNRKITHKIEQNVIIDDLSHSEVAKLFKEKKYFISYDTATAYSYLAALCGCISIVVPEIGITTEMWQPDEKLRYGVAYGFSDNEIKWAIDTQSLLIEEVNKKQMKNIEITRDFISECQEYFNKK